MALHIVVGSTNPVKIAAAQRGLEICFPGETITAEGVNVPSGISDQPMQDDETRQGALTRSAGAQVAVPNADYWFGIEGGIEVIRGELFASAWVVVRSRTQIGEARSGSFLLPESIAQLVRNGMELGHADDFLFNRQNSKQDNGSVGLLTGDRITRMDLYEHAVVLAMIPFLNPTLYPST